MLVRYVAMEIEAEPSVKPFYDFTFLLCGMVFCWDCRTELPYRSDLPVDSDERWYDQARVMRDAGWVSRLRAFAAFCPSCAAKRGFTMVDADAA